MKLNKALQVALVSIPLFVACSFEPFTVEPLTNFYEEEGALEENTPVQSHDQVSEFSEVVEENEYVKLSEEALLALHLEERAELEAFNKEKYGEFYVPLPPITEYEEPRKVLAKTLYMTNTIAGFSFDEEDIDFYARYIQVLSGNSQEELDLDGLDNVNRLEEILGICKATEINALVIDIKTDDGVVAWESDVAIVNEVGSNDARTIKDYDRLLEYLRKEDIYSIARVVAFKDPIFASAKPEHAMQLKEGGLYLDGNNEAWVSSFDSYVWHYVVAVAKEAALRGFEEIQFDYIRFPDNAKKYNPITEFPGRDGREKDEGIEDFLVFAKEELEPYHVNISADVFGQLTRSWDDIPEDIGQTWRKMTTHLDYICPMIYPSHYGPGIYGFDVPDQFPYEVMKYALEEAIERNAAQDHPGLIRPWIQGFTATWVKGNIDYGPYEISEQIRAAKELGIEEYIIWDSWNTYDPMIFFYHDRVGESMPYSGQDMMERTPEEALKRFLVAEKYGRYSQKYLLTPKEIRLMDYDLFKLQHETIDFALESYEIGETQRLSEDHYDIQVTGKYTSTRGDHDFLNQTYQVIREDGIFKVKSPDLGWIVSDLPLGLPPNEMGKIMVLMYHNLGDEEETWTRTPENFMKDLNTLYEKGYRPVSLSDFVNGYITTEKGYTPVVITVDDANLNNFAYLDDGSIDPNSMVGMLMAFGEAHPDFPIEVTFFADGPTAFSEKDLEKEKVTFIIENGMDMGNHTKNHISLKKATAEEIQSYIGEQSQYLESLIDQDYKVNTLALPYGERPKDEQLQTYLKAGEFKGLEYENIAVLNVGWNPSYSPYDERFNPMSIPRIRASETNVDQVGMYNYIDYFDKNPDQRFISDGQP